jgi:hypothetical protein
MTTTQLPANLRAAASAMGVEIMACARGLNGALFVVASRGSLMHPFVCWRWDGRGFSDGIYSASSASAFDAFDARLSA